MVCRGGLTGSGFTGRLSGPEWIFGLVLIPGEVIGCMIAISLKSRWFNCQMSEKFSLREIWICSE